MAPRVLGVDVAAETLHVALQSVGGWKERSFANSTAGSAKLGRWLERNGAGQVLACVRDAGNLWIALMAWLGEQGHSIHRFVEGDAGGSKAGRGEARRIGVTCLAQLADGKAELRLWEPPPDVAPHLREVALRIEELIATRRTLFRRARTAHGVPEVARSYREHAEELDRIREELEADIAAALAGEERGSDEW